MPMTHIWRSRLRAFGLALTLAAMSPLAFSQRSGNDDFHDKLMQIGTGPSGGSFGPIGDTLCETMNRVRSSTLVRCVQFPSAGSVFNIYAVANGSLQLGFGQEDLVAEAAVNSNAKGGNLLRSVALFHNSPIGIMVRKASGITELSQITKGIVNKGNKGSGIFANATAVLNAMNLTERDFAGVTFLPPTEFERAFCEGRVDVIFNALAHPSDLYRRLRKCGGEFLDIPPDIMKKMMANSPHLRPMDIAAGMYDAQQGEVKTLGMRNVLVSNSEVDEEAIYRVAKLINSEYKKMQLKQPYLSSMKQMRQSDVNSLAVPLHPGAKRALQEVQP
ncbi:TAXI family TRAP transporter solute-binding subunit [Limnohabitans sp. Rim8]|uniref:TAXI family TRAP transporter solute-binding subunit n=1 Tax=Limnohabitans sp. Rim8 TaxID=1100718 RepID=UPI00345A7D82